MSRARSRAAAGAGKKPRHRGAGAVPPNAESTVCWTEQARVDILRAGKGRGGPRSVTCNGVSNHGNLPVKPV